MSIMDFCLAVPIPENISAVTKESEDGDVFGLYAVARLTIQFWLCEESDRDVNHPCFGNEMSIQ